VTVRRPWPVFDRRSAGRGDDCVVGAGQEVPAVPGALVQVCQEAFAFLLCQRPGADMLTGNGLDQPPLGGSGFACWVA